MTKGTPTTEQFQHFVSNIRESFWGDVNGSTRLAWQKFWGSRLGAATDRFAVVEAYGATSNGGFLSCLCCLCVLCHASNRSNETLAVAN
jgi:hypothetical protein